MTKTKVCTSKKLLDVPNSGHVEGVIVDFRVCGSSDDYNQLFLVYEDGDVRLFRYSGSDQPDFKLNVYGRVKFIESRDRFLWNGFEGWKFRSDIGE